MSAEALSALLSIPLILLLWLCDEAEFLLGLSLHYSVMSVSPPQAAEELSATLLDMCVCVL